MAANRELFPRALVELLRAEVGRILQGYSSGAFLRWARGSGLFATNAPQRLGDPAPLAEALRAAGWTARTTGGLMRIALSPERVRALEEACAGTGSLARGLERLRGREVCEEDIECVHDCVKLLALGSGPLEVESCEKRVRQRAALALRTGGGGGLYAGACMIDIMKGRENP